MGALVVAAVGFDEGAGVGLLPGLSLGLSVGFSVGLANLFLLLCFSVLFFVVFVDYLSHKIQTYLLDDRMVPVDSLLGQVMATIKTQTP